jgi:antitoxin YefM
VQTIKSIALRPWWGRPHTRTTWYEPLDRQEDIDLAVWWVLARPDVFLMSVGDVEASEVVPYPVRLARGVAMSVTASEARQRLFPLIEEVNDDQVAVEIVSKRGTAYLVSADEYHSLKETVYLLQSPKNAERLRESIAQLRAGGAQQHELLE